jgi:hypothetical protein
MYFNIRNAAELHKYKKKIIEAYLPVLIKAISVMIFYIIGIVFYHHYEGWDIIDCMYFITITGSML